VGLERRKAGATATIRRIVFAYAIPARRVFAMAAFLALTGCALASGEGRPALAGVSIPLGAADLPQETTTTRLAAGLWRHAVRIGAPAPLPAALEKRPQEGPQEWTWRSPPLRSPADESRYGACAQDNEGAQASGGARDNEDAFLETVLYPYPGDARRTYAIINAGRYDGAEAARSAPVANALRACGYTLHRLSDAPDHDAGPWRLDIIEIDPAAFRGRLSIALANEKIAGAEPVAAIADRAGAIAAVNASFFVLSEENGVIGDIAGLSVIDGRVISESVAGRSALVLGDGRARETAITRLETSTELLWDDGSVTVADGVNRRHGRSRNCGNPGDAPTSSALHDVTCTDENEIVVYDRLAGFEPPREGLWAAYVGHDGALSRAVPADWRNQDGYLVLASGERADEMEARAATASRVFIRNRISAARMPAFAVNGAPLLRFAGADVDRADEEGWPMDADVPLRQADAAHEWINLRNPRTAVGIRDDARILLVTVDGRRPGVSVGATIAELRALMGALGARDALNLDGGGSTTLAIRSRVANTPSDPQGPRPVADALVVLPPLD